MVDGMKRRRLEKKIEDQEIFSLNEFLPGSH